MPGPARKLLVLLAVGICAVAFGGCVRIASVSTQQPASMGTVLLTVGACANGSPACAGAANTGSIFGFLDQADSDQAFPVQMLLALRLPVGATPPDTLQGTITGGGPLAFARDASYEAELQALEPAPAGERWWGWRSASATYSRNSSQGFTVTAAVSPPQSPDGAPLPSPMHWRPVVGARFSDQPGLSATRPVDCGQTNAELYSGIGETGSQPTSVCIDSPSPDAARGFLEAPIVDFGVIGTNVTAPAGSTITATFLARRTGVADPGVTFSLAAASGIPGGSVSLDRGSVSLGGDATQPVLATVSVPAGTPGGTYPVTLTATSAGKPTRTGTTTVTVPGVPGSGSGSAKPVIREAKLSPARFRTKSAKGKRKGKASLGSKLQIDVSAAANLSLTVQRTSKGRRSKGRCSPKARKGKRCTISTRIGVLARSVPAGASVVAFDGRVGGKPLRPGGYQLVLTAGNGAGKSADKRLSFTVAKP